MIATLRKPVASFSDYHSKYRIEREEGSVGKLASNREGNTYIPLDLQDPSLLRLIFNLIKKIILEDIG